MFWGLDHSCVGLPVAFGGGLAPCPIVLAPALGKISAGTPTSHTMVELRKNVA